jgi:hypothetical protein
MPVLAARGQRGSEPRYSIGQLMSSTEQRRPLAAVSFASQVISGASSRSASAT